MRKPTIKDIAAKLNVNASTVSRALKNHPDISEELRDRIKVVANELKYAPSAAITIAKRSNSKLIGLIIPEITMFFFPSVIKGVEEVVQSKGYNLLVLQSNEMLSNEKDCIAICKQNEIEGLLISVTRDTKDTEHFEQLEQLLVPIVMFDKTVKQSNMRQVIIDDQGVVELAIEHLIKSGKKRIIGIFGNPKMGITQERIAGFKKVFQKHNLPLEFDSIKYALNTNDAYRLVAQLTKLKTPDGIFTMSDEILAGVIPALNNANIKIPLQCDIVSISDGFLPYYFYPPVSYIEHSGYAVGTMAANNLFDIIENKIDPEEENVQYVETKLIDLSSL